MRSDTSMNANSNSAHNAGRKGICPHLLSLCVLIACLMISAPDARSQDDPPDAPPPPLKLISKDERTRITAESDVKKRTTLALDLMEARVVSAEKLTTASDFDGVFRELGDFQGLVDNQLEFLIRHDNDSGRILDTFKKFELGLRKFVTRIESIRRDVPSRYEHYVRKVVRFIQDARDKALEPLFSDTVLDRPKRKPNQ